MTPLGAPPSTGVLSSDGPAPPGGVPVLVEQAQVHLLEGPADGELRPALGQHQATGDGDGPQTQTKLTQEHSVHVVILLTRQFQAQHITCN